MFILFNQVVKVADVGQSATANLVRHPITRTLYVSVPYASGFANRRFIYSVFESLSSFTPFWSIDTIVEVMIRSPHASLNKQAKLFCVQTCVVWLGVLNARRNWLPLNSGQKSNVLDRMQSEYNTVCNNVMLFQTWFWIYYVEFLLLFQSRSLLIVSEVQSIVAILIASFL